MKRARITMKRYEKVISSDNMSSQRDARIQVYNGKKIMVFDDKLRVASLVTF